MNSNYNLEYGDPIGLHTMKNSGITQFHTDIVYKEDGRKETLPEPEENHV